MPSGQYKRKPMSEETKIKLSISKKGKPNGRLGTRHSEDTKRKMSLIAKSQGRKPLITDEVRKKMSLSRIGEKHPRWIKDRTKLKRYIGSNERRSPIYKDWRINVLIRDNYKCKLKGKDCSGKVEVHHILSWREYPELRYKTNNGITLCHAHHPRKRAKEKRLIPKFKELVSVSKI